MVVTQIPTVERVFSPPFAKIRSVIDVKYRRVHAQQSMLCNKAITRRNATHLSWSNEHAPRYSPRYPRCGILWILSIDRSIDPRQQCGVASRVCPRVSRGEEAKWKIEEERESAFVAARRPPLCNNPSSSEPCTYLSIYPPSFLFFFFYIYIPVTFTINYDQ